MPVEVVRSVCRVADALECIGIPFKLEESARSLETCMPAGVGVAVVTSRHVIYAYDAYHPERIVCMILKSDGTFYVVVNNREFVDFQARLRSFLSMDSRVTHSRLSCGICYASADRMKRFTFTQCPHCSFVSCIRCLKKMGELETSASQCPHCRQWKLDGDSFGTPVELLKPLRSPSSSDASIIGGDSNPKSNPISDFMDMLDQLDGETVILPRIAKQVYLEVDGRVLATCRLSGTNRYSREDDAYMTHRQLRKHLERLLHKAARGALEFCLYTVRATFSIDASAQKPVHEVSLFQITPAGRLLQLEPEAWSLSHIGMSDVHRVQVTHIPPHVFEVPHVFRRLMEQVSAEHPCHKTISVVRDAHCCANFDVSSTGEVLTMAPAMLARFSSSAFTTADGVVVVTVRVLKDETRQAAEFAAYRILGDSIERLDAVEAKRVFNRNVDGLKGSKRIMNFI